MYVTLLKRSRLLPIGILSKSHLNERCGNEHVFPAYIFFEEIFKYFTILVRGDPMERIAKDDFIQGFVPHHNHGSVDYTSVEDGHVHQCLDITSPPIQTEDGNHIHYTEGYVLFEDGHTHHYRAYSGPAIPVGNGMHVHYYDFYTTENDGHRHHVRGVDQPSPGNK